MSDAKLFLTAADIATLTGRATRNAQIAALRAMGIDHLVNADGKPIVLRALMEQRLGLAPPRQPRRKSAEPDFSALSA